MELSRGAGAAAGSAPPGSQQPPQQPRQTPRKSLGRYGIPRSIQFWKLR